MLSGNLNMNCRYSTIYTYECSDKCYLGNPATVMYLYTYYPFLAILYFVL